jgi:uncharacterized protein YndB with AHSA1/START domain
MADQVTKAAGISSEAAKAKTGKTLDEWFALLDKVGAADWPHQDIAAHLHGQCGCPNWWCQMIAVGYEQSRGLRAKNQSCAGDFTANASKTMAVPVAQLYKSWTDADSLNRWLPDAAQMTVRKANLNKSLRITWIDGQSSVEVYFWIKGPAKSQVAVQHGKLKSAKDVAPWKDYWSEALLKLQALLEGTPVPTAARSVARPARRSVVKKTGAIKKASAAQKTSSPKRQVRSKERRTS